MKIYNENYKLTLVFDAFYLLLSLLFFISLKSNQNKLKINSINNHHITYLNVITIFSLLFIFTFKIDMLHAITCSNTKIPLQTSTFINPTFTDQFISDFKPPDILEFTDFCLRTHLEENQNHQFQFNHAVKQSKIINSTSSKSSYNLNIVIIDAVNTVNEFLYIDFLNYDKLINNEFNETLQSTNSSINDKHLIILIKVSYQLNIRLLNVPRLASKKLKKLTILLYPECNVYYSNNYTDIDDDLKLKVEIKHSPSYDEQIENDKITKIDWFRYLSESFNLENEDQNAYLLENFVYFCNVAFVKIDLYSLINDLIYIENNKTNTLDQKSIYYLTEYQGKIEDGSPDVFQHCSLNTENENKNANESKTILVKEVVLINIDYNEKIPLLRIFLNTCGVDAYFFIFYVKSNDTNLQDMSILLVDHDCPIKIFVNNFYLNKIN